MDYRGRRTSVTDQNGKTTSHSYDDADRLITVTDPVNNVTTYDSHSRQPGTEAGRFHLAVGFKLN